MPRIPLLVASDMWKEGGSSWLEVIPLSTDIESATSLDLILTRSDTDLAVPWRALLRHQTVAERRDLDACIGRLTEDGQKLLNEAIAGHASDERFGSPIEGFADSRLHLSEAIENVIRQLGQSYARLMEGTESDDSAHQVLAFEMWRPKVSTMSQQILELAAQAFAAEETSAWMVEIPKRGLIRGRLEYRLMQDELFFAIEEVAEKELGLKSRFYIVFWPSLQASEPVTSEPFVPEARRQVFLGRDYGVFPGEINRLEVRLVNED